MFLHTIKSSLDVSFNFYNAFNDVNRTNIAFDNQITITNTNNANLPETWDQHNEFILIDLQCDNSFNILLNADKKLQNYYWIVLNMDATEVGASIHISRPFKCVQINRFKNQFLVGY